MQQWEILTGDCLEILPTIPAGSIDAVITDPPYPEIDREYGRLSEADWFGLMRGVVRETRRILKPSGSAVFILQPNSRKAGSMRTWLWRFLLEIAEDWNLIQDVYWWNYTTIPIGSVNTLDLLRPSVKYCIWAGSPDAYRQQSAVMWRASDESIARAKADLAKGPKRERVTSPSGLGINKATRHVNTQNGASTPYNLLPIGQDGQRQANNTREIHGATTPIALADWWIRYIVPPGGRVLDPFVGSGTMAIAAIQNGATAIGIDKMEKYTEIARRRLEQTQPHLFLAAAD